MTPKRKLAAIMFTDLVGYSALSQKNEALALELLAEHRQLLRALFAPHNGTEIKTIGDAFLVEFASAVEATRCAIAIQKMLVEHNASAPAERHIMLRIGLHIGDIVLDGDDVLGDGVNIASRIEPLAEPGGICVTEAVAEQVRNKIDTPLEKLGERKLKNIEKPVTVYRIILPWDAAKAPSKLVLWKPGKLRWIGAGAAALLLVAVVWWLAIRDEPVGKPGEITSIAVLPLDNLMGDPDQDYFVDGMHEAIISNLARIGALKVISRTSTMRYKNSNKGVPQIARELGVDAIVEGSVLRAGDRVRITAQLIHGASDKHLWVEDYERDLRDILTLQADIARAIAREIEVELTPQEEIRLTGKKQIDPKAYEAYLKGRHFWNKRTNADMVTAIQYFQQALAREPDYALAHTGIANAYITLGNWENLKATEAYPKAKRAAEAALAIDEDLAEAHCALAAIKQRFEWDWNGAEEGYKRALSLNPNYATAHRWYSEYLRDVGRLDEALFHMIKAQELDPLALINAVNVGYTYYVLHQYDKAVEVCLKTLELDPDFYPAHRYLGHIYGAKGEYEKALAEYRIAARLAGTPEKEGVVFGNIYVKSGQIDAARRVLDRIHEESEVQYVSLVGIAELTLALGDRDGAFEWLEKAYVERDSELHSIKMNRSFDSLHEDSRYIALLNKMGLEP